MTAELAAFTRATTFQSGICSLIANLQTKTQDLNDVRALFLKLDTNGDGHLSMDELRAGYAELSTIFQASTEDIINMLKAADNNGDGQIDYTEFVAAAFRKDLLLSRDNLRVAFQTLDLDGDGTITREELKKTFGGGHVSAKGEAVWNQIMAEVDKNGDGEISFEEF